MIDFHSHILPGIDDGAKNVEMSLKLLRESYRQGVTDICATPHFYANYNSPERFIRHRDRAVEELLPYLDTENIPRIHLGAEVRYFEGMPNCDELDLLKLQGTNILLLEMPFSKWTDRMWNDVEELASRGTTVMLAHIERFLHFGAEKYLTNLDHRSIMIQSNAEFFCSGVFKRQKAMKMLRNKDIDLLGSDCHNLTDRPQCLKQAWENIEHSLGTRPLRRIEAKSKALLFGEEEY